MEEKELVASLESHGIKPTANRLRIARALACAKSPMTLAELETELETIDKSNIFRALSLFRDSHFVHCIEDGCEGSRYELCHRTHDDGDDDAHVHFHCEKCHRTFCLEDIPVPPVALPDGFAPESVNYVVKGICPSCTAKA